MKRKAEVIVGVACLVLIVILASVYLYLTPSPKPQEVQPTSPVSLERVFIYLSFVSQNGQGINNYITTEYYTIIRPAVLQFTRTGHLTSYSSGYLDLKMNAAGTIWQDATFGFNYTLDFLTFTRRYTDTVYIKNGTEPKVVNWCEIDPYCVEHGYTLYGGLNPYMGLYLLFTITVPINMETITTSQVSNSSMLLDKSTSQVFYFSVPQVNSTSIVEGKGITLSFHADQPITVAVMTEDEYSAFLANHYAQTIYSGYVTSPSGDNLSFWLEPGEYVLLLENDGTTKVTLNFQLQVNQIEWWD